MLCICIIEISDFLIFQGIYNMIYMIHFEKDFNVVSSKDKIIKCRLIPKQSRTSGHLYIMLSALKFGHVLNYRCRYRVGIEL